MSERWAGTLLVYVLVCACALSTVERGGRCGGRGGGAADREKRDRGHHARFPPAGLRTRNTTPLTHTLPKHSREHANDPEVRYAAEIFYVTVFALCGVQSALVWWKKRHRRSYELVSLAGLWLVPAGLALHFRFWRFAGAWAAYSAATLFFLARAGARPLAPATPRTVFIWFLAAHKASVAVGAAGYASLALSVILAIFSLPDPFPDGAGLLLLWYGIYFGVLGRDAAEVAADRMAATLGTGTSITRSVRACGVCGGDLSDAPGDLAPPPGGVAGGVLVARGGVGDATVQVSVEKEREGERVGFLFSVETQTDPPHPPVPQLACKHLFHGTCLRGWCVVGKKDTCPACREKVDLRAVFAGRPWETRNLTWLQMLDMVRYLVVWNPLILGGLSLGLRAVGVADHEADRASLRARLAAVGGMGGAPTPA